MGASTVSADLVSGTLTKWHPIEISFSGGAVFCEDSSLGGDGKPNPFLNRRLTVVMTHLDVMSNPTHTLILPGFFAGDGAGGACGNTWMVRFTPDRAGTWTYEAHFDGGSNINLSLDSTAGTPVAFNGNSGTFVVAPLDTSAPGFLSKGRLRYVGEHYLKFADGDYFIKGGTDSPENLFAADAFDDTIDQPGGADTTTLLDGIHHYPSHVADFGAAGLGDSSDPFWTSNIGGDSRGIIGLLNYLGSRHVNSVYFLPMNLGGDGRDTYPFIGPQGTSFANTHYDLSKLRQWNMALNHAQRRGIMWNCVLAETEVGNETWFGADLNELTDERKLFFREIVARFSYLNAIKWDLSEETDFSRVALEKFADYIQALDPYDHPVTFHTHTLPMNGDYSDYTAVLGDPRFSATSIQHLPNQVGNHIEKWRADSAASGHKWVIDSDEQNGGLSMSNQDDRRKRTLYDVLFSGGSIEWYFGYFPLPEGGDLRVEDMRTREPMWDFTWYARDFILQNLPLLNMQPHDELLTGESPYLGGGEVFAWPSNAYAIYFPKAAVTGTLDLASGSYDQRWYDPRTGNFVGATTTLTGGGLVALGAPPSLPNEDWVLLIEPDQPVFGLSFTDMTPGVPNAVNSSSLSGATPGGPLIVFYSLEGTSSFPLPGCNGVHYNLVNSKYAFTMVADGAGVSDISIFITTGPPVGTTAYLQALDPFGCSVSNVTTFNW